MKLPEKLYVAENCPREGWQKYKCFIPTESKIRIIKSMVDYGAKDIELGMDALTQDERSIILKGCLINFNAAK